ncbi:hypothetical protein EXN66_Car000119 [Channa argus]|uniref:Uncharacterized protein n=1 Tax=Channa argus TaxID=215402 RepID=A0A6G1QXK6_CHAAH|nr:hypothetical protein EXN66_Car000119 [Channa argus]
MKCLISIKNDDIITGCLPPTSTNREEVDTHPEFPVLSPHTHINRCQTSL